MEHLIGLTEDDASKIANILVVEIDGEPQGTMANWEPNRVNVVITNGIISKIVGFG